MHRRSEVHLSVGHRCVALHVQQTLVAPNSTFNNSFNYCNVTSLLQLFQITCRLLSITFHFNAQLVKSYRNTKNVSTDRVEVRFTFGWGSLFVLASCLLRWRKSWEIQSWLSIFILFFLITVWFRLIKSRISGARTVIPVANSTL